ncbi:MAG TPA: carboxypeptidase-like regulatory domain-containing protein [Nitrosopumilaceae archaeon]|nr:carboxypeptidase-like regulatory domain-containing protein [Nitrosopumilaceae archaeon]
MNKIQLFFIIFSMLLVIPLTSDSQAVLWDLLIEANVENSPLYSGGRPIVSGIIVDHASKPVHNATVNIRSEAMSIFTKTSQSGEFQVELGKHERLPGNYIVNISANTPDGTTGISSIQFQVKGELAHATANHVKLSTLEAQKYLKASPEDFDNNPVGFMLYNYYQKVYQDYLKDEEISNKITQEKITSELQKEDTEKLRLKAIEKFNPSYGIFTGPEYENYVNSLNDGVRDTVVEQLNFTKNLFEEAQELRIKILENGGSAEEAQIAYLDKLIVTREMIESINNNSTNNLEKNSSNVTKKSFETLNENSNEQLKISGGYAFEDELIGEPVYQDPTVPLAVDKISNQPVYQDSILPPVVDKVLIDAPIQVVVNGINVEVNYIGSIFYVNVNGTVLEFLVNGTEITRLNNLK